jgi:hypothetical protein
VDGRVAPRSRHGDHTITFIGAWVERRRRGGGDEVCVDGEGSSGGAERHVHVEVFERTVCARQDHVFDDDQVIPTDIDANPGDPWQYRERRDRGRWGRAPLRRG